MDNLLLIISIFILSFDIKTRAEDDTLVNISDGLLKGTIITSRNGRNISAFLGVPYAEPPIGNLRFKSPEPIKKWKEIYYANKEGNACPQPVNGKVDGKEDCLYLNVFTPKLKFNELMNETLLPVMVWIHGGGFHLGSSGLNFYGPKYLMDKNIIFVSMNYRLGILGFLTTADNIASGNFGLKDQVLALKWIQNNIRVFGGDPKRVTIFGESAGGASVSFHALSDKSNGLFHQYIAQSGNALVPWGFRDKNEIKSDVKKIAKKFDCSISNSKLIVNCLRNVDYYKLVNLTTYNVLDFPEISWLPTNEIESNDAFLTDTPENLINENKLRDYPLMSGSVADEGLYVTAPFYANSTSRSIENVLKKCINGTFNRYSSIKDLSKFVTIIKDYYFNGTIFSSKNRILKNFTKFAGDSQFVYPVAILTEKLAKFGKKPIYLYMFGYRGEISYLNMEYGLRKNIGVNHADDLLYLLSGEHSKYISRTDEYVIDLMVDLWTSFAINGKPTSGQLADSNLWKSYSTTKSFLQIGNILNNTEPCVTLQKDYLTDRLNLWKNNFPLIKL